MDVSGLTISQVRDLLRCPDGVNTVLLDSLDADPRAGVRRLALRERRRRKSVVAERARLEKMRVLEKRLHARGLHRIAGVDEAGRGPLAGPVVAAAVILPREALIPGLNDSKVLTPDRRSRLYERITETAVALGIGEASAAEIDRINILQATYLAMRRAIKGLGVPPDRVLVDGPGVPGSPFPESAVIDGDAASLSISAASILAKVTRDRKMAVFHSEFPEYGFANHKGYGSADHRRALRVHGPCRIHRLSFRGVRSDSDSESALESAGTAGGATGKDGRPPRAAIAQSQLFRTGTRGENAAAATLARTGYRILRRNYRAAGGEVDLIVSNDHAIAFVEVKTRASEGFGPPEIRVTPEKQRQIARVARAYLQRHPSPGLAPRFDVVAVHYRGGSPRIRHLESAFRPEI
ncbi:MAG: ribonuclease HII [Gemmatimonadota bacterium]|nr:ribonuclease HII [Gemmatimonadota bacterium]